MYQDFFAYKSGVYRHVTGGVAGGHCVTLIGYDDGQGCWIAKNQWGTGWGDGGFFKIPLEIQREVWPHEDFELVTSLVETTIPEDDLFAGIRGTELD